MQQAIQRDVLAALFGEVEDEAGLRAAATLAGLDDELVDEAREVAAIEQEFGVAEDGDLDDFETFEEDDDAE